MGSDVGSDQYRLVNLLKAAGEEIEEADNVDYDDYHLGVSQIGVVLQTLVQSQVLDMKSMIEKFLSSDHSTI